VFTSLILSSFIGLSLTEVAVDQLVSKRVVVAERTVKIDLCVRTGDPLGSQDAGTLMTIGEPRLTALHKEPAYFLAGGRYGEVPFGIQITVTPRIRLDGKIQLDCYIKETTRVAEQLESVKTTATAVLSPGEGKKVRVSSRSATDQTWIELDAKVIEPEGTPVTTGTAKVFGATAVPKK
jgi:hypothetical protein